MLGEGDSDGLHGNTSPSVPQEEVGIIFDEDAIHTGADGAIGDHKRHMMHLIGGDALP